MTSAARWRALILVLWAVLICCVAVGSLAPASSSLMVAVGRSTSVSNCNTSALTWRCHSCP
jgi:hypothetical protein